MQPAPLPSRPHDAHKGVFGTVGIIGGRWTETEIMLGAPALAARAAFRSGCGRVVVVGPAAVVSPCLQMCSSATGVVLPLNDEAEIEADRALGQIRQWDTSVHAWAIGPGLGAPSWACAIVRDLFMQSGPPLVLDADGLGFLTTMDPQMVGESCRSCILTPHPGEFDRLAQAWSLPVCGTNPGSRIEAATALAVACGSVVVLKGHRTVVADGHGDHWVCDAGGPELASGGTGDVLAGVIASLIAQGVPAELADTVCLGVDLHAAAGAFWRSQHGDRGILAMELADVMPEVIQQRSRL